MDAKIIEAYCGKAIMELRGKYYFVDMYSGKFQRESLEKCENLMSNYKNELADRDPIW